MKPIRMNPIRLAALIAFGAVNTAHAQGATAPAPAPTPPATYAVLPATAPQIPAQQAPASTPAPTPERRIDRTPVMPQGFSVVLVMADLQATTAAQDDVPPAARKALTDLKDFLPYKSFKLLDAAWVMCCGSGSGDVLSRMKGPDDQDYELRLSATSTFVRGEGPADNPRIYVSFALRSTGDVASVTSAVEADLRAQLAALEAKLRAARENKGVTHPDVKKVQQEIEAARDRLSQATDGKSPAARRSSRAIVDTNFKMDIGETVVVGTSRLGGSRALIAMLTAVPARAGRRE
jgi:hypothetical protein